MNALEKTGPRRSRSVNVIDVGNLDPRFAYRMPRELLMKGVYEDWTTAANLCVQTSKQTGSFSVDFIAAASGIRSLRRKDVKVNLGTMLSDKFFRQTGAPRRFFAFTIPIGAKHCRWKLEDIHGGRSRAGYFYTDASGGVLEAGPGEKHVRQFAKPGFETVLEGQYEAVESWTGLYVRGAKGHLEDYEYGLDPDLN